MDILQVFEQALSKKNLSLKIWNQGVLKARYCRPRIQAFSLLSHIFFLLFHNSKNINDIV